MTDFAFNFGVGVAETKSEQQHKDDELLEPAEEISIDLTQDAPVEMEQCIILPDLHLLKGRVVGRAAAELLQSAELNESDLVPGKYEGGFKLWEGAVDLCQYMCEHFGVGASLFSSTTDVCPFLKGKRVLELGCGHGLPGIIAMLAGAEVHFQDFNKEVLQQLAAPNVKANRSRLPVGRRKPRVRFFAGDWGSLGELLSHEGLGGHYDVILTAETVYNIESQKRLLECIKQVISPPHGYALVAAKSYYFGVGGGSTSFAKLVKEDGILECAIVWSQDDGSSIKREILKLSFSESITPFFL